MHYTPNRDSNPVSNTPPPFRIGHGYDLHRLETPQKGGRPMILGGLAFESDRGPVGHSDGDALLHAITDALLGALALPDLGTLFPNSDPANDGRDSEDFLVEALRRVTDAGYELANLDCTVILERPKIGPRRAELAERISGILGVSADRVNVKGKTHETVDAVGEGRAVEVHVVALLVGRGS